MEEEQNNIEETNEETTKVEETNGDVEHLEKTTINLKWIVAYFVLFNNFKTVSMYVLDLFEM